MDRSAGWFRSLRRVTSSGKFIPEIDGLRFIAIGSVLVYHINGEYLKVKGPGFPNAGHGLLHNLMHTGNFGVQLFFVISGFILSLPFVHHYCDGAKKPSLRRFYVRRITRIEPPFVINLVIVLMLLVWVKGLGFTELLPNFAASLFYLHNVIYQRGSDINFVAWSLEIEAQFYILAPLLAMMLSFRRPVVRWGIVLGATGAMAAIVPLLRDHWPVVSLTLIGQLPYFLAGFLVAGKYVSMQKTRLEPHLGWDLAGVASWGIMAYLLLHRSMAAEVILPFTVAAAYICMLNGYLSRSLLSIPLVTTIGGMCYTIYLYHPFLKSAFKNGTFSWGVGHSYWLNSVFQIFLLGSIITVACAVLFVLFERPFMVPDWPARVVSFFWRPKRRGDLAKPVNAVSEAP